MARKDFTVEFEFTSTQAYGDNYTRRIAVKAETAREAETVARFAGWEEFGARFTDNCVDWRVVNDADASRSAQRREVAQMRGQR
jgi:hypothetical protein